MERRCIFHCRATVGRPMGRLFKRWREYGILHVLTWMVIVLNEVGGFRVLLSPSVGDDPTNGRSPGMSAPQVALTSSLISGYNPSVCP